MGFCDNLSKFIERMRPRDVVEFSNFLNVCRYLGIDNFVPSRYKQKVTHQIINFFKDKELSKEMEEQGIEAYLKTMSDMIFYVNTYDISKKIQEWLAKPDVFADIGSLLKVTEHIALVENGFEQNDRLLRRIE